jgi:hypothetical protein
MGVSDIRQELIVQHNYLQLVNSLILQDNSRAVVNEKLSFVTDFLENATSKEMRAHGKELLISLKKITDHSSKYLPRRKPIVQIALEFNKLCQNSDVWRYGIPYGWASKSFDLSELQIDTDLPPHAKLGIGVHAGKASVEEAFLLEDMFILLARAEDMYKSMIAFGEQLKSSPDKSFDQTIYSKLSVLNSEVCTYSRLCVINSAAFVEAFVNSVGWAEAELRADINHVTREELRGLKNNRYTSLERKLESYPKLIRADGKSPIILSDTKQRKEPFISFLSETKELRDSSMHSSPNKAPIWLPPQKWLEFAQRSVKHSLWVAREFWRACYPDRELPEYLERLDEVKLHNNASNRVSLLTK